MFKEQQVLVKERDPWQWESGDGDFRQSNQLGRTSRTSLTVWTTCKCWKAESDLQEDSKNFQPLETIHTSYFVPFQTFRSFHISILSYLFAPFQASQGVAVQVMSQQIAGALAIDTHGAIVIRKMSSCKLVKPHEFTVSEFTDTGGNLRPKLCAFFCHRALSTWECSDDKEIWNFHAARQDLSKA